MASFLLYTEINEDPRRGADIIYLLLHEAVTAFALVTCVIEVF